MLRQDDDLLPAAVRAQAPARLVLVGASSATAIAPLLSVAEPLSRRPPRELFVPRTVAKLADLERAAVELEQQRARLASRGVVARAAAFVSTAGGPDLVRMAREQDVDLLLVDPRGGVLRRRVN